MQNSSLHFHYKGWDPESIDVSGFIPYLKSVLPEDFYSSEAWRILTEISLLASEIHKNDTRKLDNKAYFNHNIEVMLAELALYLSSSKNAQDTKYDLLGHLLVEALHDSIEDHPESWRFIFGKLQEILGDEILALQLFMEILTLATGGIIYDIRSDLLRFFFDEYHDYLIDNQPNQEDTHLGVSELKMELLVGIIKLLNPVDPLFKLINESDKYIASIGSEEFVRIYSAIELYRHDILLKKAKDSDSKEYIALGNYIFFSKDATHRKAGDMLSNMGDMRQMEKIKPGYIATRRIKAFILCVKLMHYGMWDELQELESVFRKNGVPPLTGADVTKRMEELGITVPSTLEECLEKFNGRILGTR